MRPLLKKVLAGLVGTAGAAALLPLGLASPAAAAPTGPATLSPTSSSNSNNPFTLSLPLGASCAGDTAAGNWNVGSYVVPKAVNPETLRFDAILGPFVPGGPDAGTYVPYADHRQPLYDAATTAGFTAGSTAAADTPGGPGAIVSIPNFTFATYAEPGSGFELPPGEYNVGLACYQALPGQFSTDRYWNTTITVTANPSDPGLADISWSVGTVAAAPTLDSVTAGNGTLTVAFTRGASDPADVLYTVYLDGVATGFTATNDGTDIVVTGLTNGTAYNVTVVANNGVGNSAPSNAISQTPVAGARNNVTGVNVPAPAPGATSATVNWTEPATNDPVALPVSYSVVVDGGAPVSVPAPATSYVIAGPLSAGSHSVSVTAVYGDAPVTGTVPATAPVFFTILPNSVLIQEISTIRPTGALVITQVCGAHGPIAAEPVGTTYFPAGLPAVADNGSHVGAPVAGLGTPGLDPGSIDTSNPGGVPGTGAYTPSAALDSANRPEYPYPTDANGTPDPSYPTYCGLELGRARFITQGPGAGQFFAASGVLNQVTVVDTRDDDEGWDITGQASNFTANSGTDSFSGDQLGWQPQVTEDTGAWTDALGNPYDQVATAGAPVAPNTTGGLFNGETLASAAQDVGLGIAILDARLKLLIPVTADAGVYQSTLTITAA